MQIADEPGLPVPVDPWGPDSGDCPLTPYTGCFYTTQRPPGSPIVVRACHGCGRIDGHHLAAQVSQWAEDIADDVSWLAEVEETIRVGTIQLAAEAWGRGALRHLLGADLVDEQGRLLGEVLRGQAA